MTHRCGVCGACQRVEDVRKQAIGALSRSLIQISKAAVPIGEDVRLIWNRTLEENPCDRSGVCCADCGKKFEEFEPFASGMRPDRFGVAKPVHIYDCMGEDE